MLITNLLFARQVIAEELSTVFVIVTVNTKILPVRPIRRVIHVVSIFMMDGQEMPRLIIKLSSTFGADETVYLQRAFPIITALGRELFYLPKDFFDRFIGVYLLRPLMDMVRFVSHRKGSLSDPPIKL